MAELKAGWRRWRFDQMATSITERVDDPKRAGVEYYVGLEHLDSDSLKIRRWGSPADVSATKLLFEPGDIIFGRRRAYQRKLGVAEFRGIASAHSLVLRAKPEVVLPEFLPFFMQSDIFMERAQEISVGSLSPTINWRTLAKQEFALPPLEEQRRMVVLFNTSKTVADEATNLTSAAEQLELSIIDHVVDEWMRNYPIVTVRDVIQGQPESGCSAPEASSETGHYVLALSALRRFGYYPGELKSVYPTDAMSRALLDDGDVLVSRSNTSERVGFVGIYRQETSVPVSFPDTMLRLRPITELIGPEVLEMVFQSSMFRRQIVSIAAGTSASMKKINKRNLLKLRLPLPPLSEQNQRLEFRVKAKQALLATNDRTRAAIDHHMTIVNELTGA